MNDRLNELEKDIADKTGLPQETIHELDQVEATLEGTDPETVAEHVDNAVNADLAEGVDVREKAAEEAADYEAAVEDGELAAIMDDNENDVDESDCLDD